MSTTIRIEITGPQASGKTVTLKAIKKFLETKFGCTVAIKNQRLEDFDVALVTIPDGRLADMVKGL